MSAVLYLKSDRMGMGDDGLGRKLLRSFLSTMLASETRIDRIICVNSGVFLTTEGTPVLEELRDFEKQGVKIFSCGTCLRHFGLESKVMVGRIGDMVGTVTALNDATRVITP
ncbi:sulfurtransferase-like selenium metabolism protein YedF [Acidobacteriota bacterium]